MSKAPEAHEAPACNYRAHYVQVPADNRVEELWYWRNPTLIWTWVPTCDSQVGLRFRP